MWVYVEGYRLHFSYLTIESQVLIPVTKLRGEIPIGAQKDSNLMKNIQQKSIWKLWPTYYLLKISQTLNKTSSVLKCIVQRSEFSVQCSNSEYRINSLFSVQ